MTVTAEKINLKGQETSGDFEQIFKEYWSRIYEVVFRLVGDPDEAQDLALQTFWRYYRNPPAKRDNIAGWLYKVAVNLGFNAMRDNRRRSSYENQAGTEEIVQRSIPGPEQEVILAEERQAVRGVLVDMKPRSTKLLVLRYSGLTYAEIAEVLNINPSSIGKLLARAHDEFKVLYNQIQGG
jgi:RNA polymerase sigma factor (sigma-70 family)